MVTQCLLTPIKLMSFLCPKWSYINTTLRCLVKLIFVNKIPNRKVQVGKDQEKAQSEKDSHFKNRGGKKPN